MNTPPTQFDQVRSSTVWYQANKDQIRFINLGAEPSPAYFNILMHGEEPEVLDGTQLAADWTFSGLQKFGQGLMDRLRGQKLPSKLLERVSFDLEETKIAQKSIFFLLLPNACCVYKKKKNFIYLGLK